MKIIMTVLGLVGMLWTSSISEAERELLNISKTESSVGWKAAKVTGEHWGKVSISDAKLDYENGRIQGGSFEIDMRTITVEDIKDANSNKRLVDHLRSDDFFSVDKFNKSSMTIIDAKTSNGKDYEIKANLIIKGISQPVSFPVSVSEEGNKVIATGKITFDRTKYDIKYRSGNYFENLADRLIYDEVSLDVKLVGMK